jgi:hypothetical protein
MTKLKYLSDETLENLRSGVAPNLGRYRHGGFADLMPLGDWSLELDFEADLSFLEGLDPSGTPKAEINNSRRVWKALGRLTPALACQEGIWARLTHVECLAFSRDRWIPSEADDKAATKLIEDHFFCPTLTSRRDDNAISRLWWNAYIANLANPDAALPALDVILQKADVRSNFVERSMTASRPSLAAGMIRIMQRVVTITEREDNFRAFMRSVNKMGGGIVFEAMSEVEIDAFMKMCATRAGLVGTANTSGLGSVAPQIMLERKPGENRAGPHFSET